MIVNQPFSHRSLSSPALISLPKYGFGEFTTGGVPIGADRDPTPNEFR